MSSSSFRTAASRQSSLRPQGASRSGPSFYPSLPTSSSTPKPPPLWYTARPSLNSTLSSLTSSLTATRSHLHKAGLLSSISPSSGAPGRETEFSGLLPHPRQRRWKQPKAMATYLRNGTELKMAQYKAITGLLGQLEGLLPYAQLADELRETGQGKNVAGEAPTLNVDPVESTRVGVEPVWGDAGSLRAQLEQMLGAFQHPSSLSASGESIVRVVGKARPLGVTDDYGRIMSVGRRKEASARVWLSAVVAPSSEGSEPVPGAVLVNAKPLAEYFTQDPMRSRTVLPLSLTGALGSFNVFAIVKGGGKAAQADAVAVGVARALVEWEKAQVEAGEWEEEVGWREALKKAELLERDPRVVERKKTGQLKARKKFAWVKR